MIIIQPCATGKNRLPHSLSLSCLAYIPLSEFFHQKTSMTRWHHSSCTSPDVVLNSNNWPTCEACGSFCPSQKQLISSQAANGLSPLKLPPDEAPGQLNLWWPLTVPYVDTHGTRVKRPARITSTSTTPELSKQISPIYGNTLRDNEFRLACLSAVPYNDYPVHVTLETFTHDSRPEYVSTSYLWGGEDADSSPRRAIFVGEFWDVLLQTENCWSMLRFLRPWRGIRMVWVDALCINQRNIEERGAQVSDMR